MQSGVCILEELTDVIDKLSFIELKYTFLILRWTTPLTLWLVSEFVALSMVILRRLAVAGCDPTS